MKLIKILQRIVKKKLFEGDLEKVIEVRCSHPLQIEDLNNGKDWKVLQEIKFSVKIRYKDFHEEWKDFVILYGFITDLASVEGVPIIKVRKLTVGNRWYVIHDFGYRINSLDKKTWDTIMLMGLKKDGASSALSWRRWIGVRIGGRIAWNRYRMKKG